MKYYYLLLLALFISCEQGPNYDTIIRGATIIDGSGNPGYVGDIAIQEDTIVAIGNIYNKGITEIAGEGLVVSPGFVNMLSWATVSLIEDGRGMSDILQGVTLEVMGEGMSMGPLSDTMKEMFKGNQGDIKYDIEWTTLGEYLYLLEN